MNFEIISGPSLDELLDSFRYAYDDAYKPVEFGVVFSRNNDGERVVVPMSDVRVSSIQHADGSGASFNLEGRCKATGEPDKCLVFRAYYSTEKHSGWIFFPPF
jgi:hypothetical protein